MTQTHGSKAPDNGGGAVANAAINGIMGMLKQNRGSYVTNITSFYHFHNIN